MEKLTTFKVDPKRFHIWKENVRLFTQIHLYTGYLSILCGIDADDFYNFFDLLILQYIRNLQNFSAEQPYQHAVYYLTVLLTEHSWSKEELLASIDRELLQTRIPRQ